MRQRYSVLILILRKQTFCSHKTLLPPAILWHNRSYLLQLLTHVLLFSIKFHFFVLSAESIGRCPKVDWIDTTFKCAYFSWEIIPKKVGRREILQRVRSWLSSTLTIDTSLGPLNRPFIIVRFCCDKLLSSTFKRLVWIIKEFV